MAPSAKLFSLIFLLALSLSSYVRAREVKFFSKATHDPNTNDEGRESNFRTYEDPEPLTKPDQEPTFFPQTQDGYGLYGHESGQLPTTTTTTTTAGNIPYKTGDPAFRVDPNESKNFYYNKNRYGAEHNGLGDAKLADAGYGSDSSQDNNNFYYNGGDSFDSGKNDNSRHTVVNKGSTEQYGGYGFDSSQANNNFYYNGGESFDSGNNDNSRHTVVSKGSTEQYDGKVNRHEGKRSNGGNRYDTETFNGVNGGAGVQIGGVNGYNPQGQGTQRYGDENRYDTQTFNGVNGGAGVQIGGVNGYNPQRQGMSDTRFMENGKYYHAIYRDNSYNNGYKNSRFDSKNQNNNRGYGSFEFNNPAGGYKNQESYADTGDEILP